MKNVSQLGLRIAEIWRELVEYLNCLGDNDKVGPSNAETSDEGEALR